MTRDRKHALLILLRYCTLPPAQPISEWVEQNICFDEPKLRGPFSFSGREYIREMLNEWNDPEVSDYILALGTGVGKTITFMAAMGWKIAWDPCRCLWVFPTTDGPGGASSFNRTRFMKMIRATPALRALMPKSRHDFATKQMQMAGSVFDFAGSNSPAQLAANRCDEVIQDETDKFNEGTEREANASYLADERTKGMPLAKRRKASSPTLKSGIIWQSLMKSDVRRRFMPCPHCGKLVVFAWSKRFTVLPLTGAEAFIRWDKEAARADGSWDLDRVVRSARMECPHCAGHILDAHKHAMDKNGIWKPTQQGAPGWRGRHLPSMYAPGFESNFGQMAKKFLLAKRSVDGLRGFINSDLAEPDDGQDVSVERVELIKKSEVTSELKLLMTVDCQQKAPYFWYVIRAWGENSCHGIKAGSADTYEDLRKIQLAHGVQDIAVWLDSGFRARSGEAEVYRNCAAYGELIPTRRGLAHIGWMPTKGMPSSKRWNNPETKQKQPYSVSSIDPFMGTEKAGQIEMNLFEFSADYFKDILDDLRKRRSTFARNFVWSADENMMDDMGVYWKHMDGQIKKTIVLKSGWEKQEYRPRGRYWPDHIYACEYAQIAQAMFFERFRVDEK